MSCIQFFVCAALAGVSMLLVEPVFFSAMTRAWLPIVYAGVLSSGAGYTLQILGPEGHRPGGGVSSDEYGIGVCHAGGLGAAGAGTVTPGAAGLWTGFCRDHSGAAVEHAKKT